MTLTEVLIERLPELDRQVRVYEAWGKRNTPMSIINNLDGWIHRLWHVGDLSTVMSQVIYVRGGIPTGWFEVEM